MALGALVASDLAAFAVAAFYVVHPQGLAHARLFEQYIVNANVMEHL